MLSERIRDIKENSLSHGSLPFWSWNDKLEEGELRRQIRNMHDLGMNGFFMHARGGLVTEYMSDEWFRAINVCIDEAKKLGMEAWSYDENGWPSGFAGGKLLEDSNNFARGLAYTAETAYPEDEAMAVYVLENNRARRVTAPVAGCTEYHVIRGVEDNSYVDILNRDVIAKFIRETHEVYKQKIAPEDFGKTMPGFFTDEPQYFRRSTPWSNILPHEFRSRYGYDIMENLVALFVDCENFRTLRYDYHKLIADLYIDSFVKQIYDWCEANGCQLTGHTIVEETLTGQMMCCGGAMRFYCYEHIPGIDWLGRNLRSDMLTRQLGSVCAQLGKKKAISETFAMCGWDVSPRELKNIADFQYAGGVNLMCQHLYTYSCRGERKFDYPAHFSEYLPWQKHLREFDSYYNHLGYLLSQGEENVRTLVIHPIHNAYMYYIREVGKPSIANEEESTTELLNRLSRNQIAYHLGDENMMRDMAKVQGKAITLGKCRYDRVIVPDVESLDASTADLLKQYVAAGGKVILAGKTPTLESARPADYAWLHANMTMDDLIRDQEITVRDADGNPVADFRVMNRIVDGKRIFFVTNIRHTDRRGVRITVKNCENLAALDVAKLQASPVCGEKNADGSFTLLTSIGDAESLLLVETGECPARPLADYSAKTKPFFLPPQTVRFHTKPRNTLVLDNVSYSADGKNYSDPIPLVRLCDDLLRTRFRGPLYIRQTFSVEEIPASLSLACEPLPYTSFTVNGKDVTFGDEFFMERCFRTADITALVKKGENEIRYCLNYFQRDYVYYVLYSDVSETLRNCLRLDTELAVNFLYGDFAVRTDPALYTPEEHNAFTYTGSFAITRSKDTVTLDNVLTDGLPFFAGCLDLTFRHHYRPGDPTVLRLAGRYAVCEVSVNGKDAGLLLFGDNCDLSGLLQEGENRIDLHLYNANRNLLGPLHHSQIEPFSVGPKTFTCAGTFRDGVSPDYLADRYCFVRFGLDCE